MVRIKYIKLIKKLILQGVFDIYSSIVRCILFLGFESFDLKDTGCSQFDVFGRYKSRLDIIYMYQMFGCESFLWYNLLKINEKNI